MASDSAPIPPFRGALPPNPEKIGAIELTRAINEQATGKAPGADGIMMEVYKNLPAVRPVMLELFNHVYCSGEIPALF